MKQQTKIYVIGADERFRAFPAVGGDLRLPPPPWGGVGGGALWGGAPLLHRQGSDGQAHRLWTGEFVV